MSSRTGLSDGSDGKLRPEKLSSTPQYLCKGWACVPVILVLGKWAQGDPWVFLDKWPSQIGELQGKVE